MAEVRRLRQEVDRLSIGRDRRASGVSEDDLVAAASKPVPSAENTRLFDAFVAGFLTSGEGWNGEWPYGMYGPINHPQRAEVQDALRSRFEEWMQQSDGSPSHCHQCSIDHDTHNHAAHVDGCVCGCSGPYLCACGGRCAGPECKCRGDQSDGRAGDGED